MSCYEWESGTIIIPAATWAAFKKTLRDRYTRAVAEDFATAERFVADLKTANKGKRGVVWRQVAEEFIRNLSTRCFKVRDPDEVLRLLVAGGTTTLLRPKKKDFAAATNKTMAFKAGLEASFHLDDKAHSVHWGVPENNHACDDAHASFMAGALFAALSTTTWVRNSGGTIVGNNEYNTDNKEEGGGANQVKFRFGPLGRAAGASGKCDRAPGMAPSYLFPTMKNLCLILCLGLTFSASAFGADQLTASIEAANYRLFEVLRAQKTYCGTLVNAHPVQIQAWKFPNLIVGLVGGISNGVLGTRFGAKTLPAWEYVIRLDQVNGFESELVTVVQGGRGIEAGTPVFVTTGDASEFRTFGVRVIAATTPETYGRLGLEEARQAAMQRPSP